MINQEGLIAHEDLQSTQHAETPDWSLALAYSGALGENDNNRYRIPNPECPDVECPDGEIEITEKSRHYMPLVIGLSVNKSLTSYWSIETGLRYTFLRSDFLLESELMNKERIQRIHYIGVPLKINYRIFTYNGFFMVKVAARWIFRFMAHIPFGNIHRNRVPPVPMYSIFMLLCSGQ